MSQLPHREEDCRCRDGMNGSAIPAAIRRLRVLRDFYVILGREKCRLDAG